MNFNHIIIKGLLMLTAPLFIACSASRQTAATSPEADSSQFVNLTDVVPDAIMEIRYYSTYNFVGDQEGG